ncbi:unnamed protein product [Urochloa decumbens]|uniref:BED-type domain-containing protein n=1 Tax=Urochloa decumbens TaxID=240449 RepID=A0ABC9BV35_9POAL
MATQQGSVPAQERQQPARKKKMAARSGVWEFFTRFTGSGDGKAKAECKKCHLVLGADTRSGTSTLWAHVRICWGDEVAVAARAPRPPPPLPCAPHSRTRSPGRREPEGLHDGEVSGDLARMIALHGYDPSFVEDGYFRSFVRSLNPEFVVPTRVAIEEMCDGIFDEARRDLLDRLKHAPGKVSLSVGRAKVMEEQVVYVACHFIDDEWNLHRLVLHASVTGDDRNWADGPILGFDVARSIDDDVIEAIGRHGIYNEFMVAYETTDKDIHFTMEESFEPVLMFGTNPSSRKTIYVDNVLHSIAQCFSTRFWEQDVFCDMWNLNLNRQDRLQLLSELGLDYEWACGQHWCAFYFSLEVLRKKSFANAVNTELVVKQLRKVWEQVYRGIQRISAPTFPTSNLCLEELLKLSEILQAEIALFSGDEDADVQEGYGYFDDDKLEDILREASNTLDKAIQDSYLVWSVPLALDPRYKLRYIEFSFQRVFGSEEAGKYVLEVTSKINNLYADYIIEYGTITSEDQSDGSNAMMDMDTTSADQWEQAWNNHRSSQDIMAAQVNSCYPETKTELDRYLQDPLALETKDFDVLNWWKVRSSEYPMVARMARDDLAMPTCSKLSSDQLAQIRSILRDYSKKPFGERYYM